MIVRLAAAAFAAAAGFVLIAYAADEIASLLGERFADAVISPDNVKEGS